MAYSSSPATKRSRVVIAGGGFAALEAALALRALAKDRVELTLVSPNASFAYRPAATLQAFGQEATLRYDLRGIAADLRATYHESAVEAVASQQHSVGLGSGIKLEYDYLVLAVGARARIGVPGALTFRGQRDLSRFRILLGDVDAGGISRLVFAVPTRDSWSLPVYELALLSAAHAASHRVDAEIALVTPERSPLEVFGSEASRLVADLLAEREIAFVGNAFPHSVQRDGSLALQFDAPIRADRVVAVPELRGLRITGVPANWSGFVAVDGLGRVEGLTDVYAAGDMTTYPIKQGGLAAQQADLIAHTIAAELGAPVKELHQSRVLRARLLNGEGSLALRTELDALGRPTGCTVEHPESRRAPDLKVFGLYLTPYLSIHRSRLAVAA